MAHLNRTHAVLLCLCISASACTEDKQVNNAPQQATAIKLNDTGVTTCADDVNNTQACPTPTNPDLPNQDAEYGRDLTHNDDSDGHAGFEFTKISQSGVELAATEKEWSCVKDQITGLTWEVKTPEQPPNNFTPTALDLRSSHYTYSWYSPNNDNNVLFGQYNGGDCFGSGANSCDTYGYINSLNKIALCGYSDWRLPSKEELRSIVDYSNPITEEELIDINEDNPIAIDKNYFPYTNPETPPNKDALWYWNQDPRPFEAEYKNKDHLWYWTSEHYAGNLNFAWQINFNHGSDGREYKYAQKLIRLVRGN